MSSKDSEKSFCKPTPTTSSGPTISIQRLPYFDLNCVPHHLDSPPLLSARPHAYWINLRFQEEKKLHSTFVMTCHSKLSSSPDTNMCVLIVIRECHQGQSAPNVFLHRVIHRHLMFWKDNDSFLQWHGMTYMTIKRWQRNKEIAIDESAKSSNKPM